MLQNKKNKLPCILQCFHKFFFSQYLYNCEFYAGNMDKCLHSASSLCARVVNFEEMGEWSIEGVPWRPCRFPIKQMPAGTRATPQASASISSCSLGARQRICLSLSLLVIREGFDHRTCRMACEIRTEFTTCAFHIEATLTYKSYTALFLFRREPLKDKYFRYYITSHLTFSDIYNQ